MSQYVTAATEERENMCSNQERERERGRRVSYIIVENIETAYDKVITMVVL